MSAVEIQNLVENLISVATLSMVLLIRLQMEDF